jgi:erythromycin esterase
VRIAIAFICSLLGCVTSAGAGVAPLQDRIQKNVFAVRSIDPTDEDFSDLEPLMDKIGTARVVQLGEPSHGAGSGFSAKARMVKFLHERMGFDVLVWESGLYDVGLTAEQGIFAMWAKAAQVQPLLEYVKSTRATLDPLDMAGFDVQFNSDISFNRFANDLHEFLRPLPNTALRATALEHANSAIAAYGAIRRRIHSGSQRPDADAFRKDRDTLQDSAGELLAIMRDQRQQFLQVHSPLALEMVEHVAENMRTDGLNLYDAIGPDRPAGTAAFTPRLEVENRRDARNAVNLLWLIQQVNAGRKVIVWAHNTHVMNAYYASDWHIAYSDPHEDSMKPTGVFLREKLGDQVYTIVMTAYEGVDGWVGARSTTAVEAASAGSIEETIHRLGKPYAFFDLRSLKAQPAQARMRLPKYDENTFQDLTRVADGVFYIDHMAPASAISSDPH